MSLTITFDCPWCKTRNQTGLIGLTTEALDAPEGLFCPNPDARVLAIKCRACTGISAATVEFSPGTVGAVSVGQGGDVTRHVDQVYLQSPPFDEVASTNWPDVVRECMLDGFEGRSPRAQCQCYRAAIEAAVRAAGFPSEPGQSLGQILSLAKKKYAVSDALIELCDSIKAFGNWGLHWSEMAVDKEDAAAAREISVAVLSYLFDLPAKVDHARIRTEHAKDAHYSGNS